MRLALEGEDMRAEPVEEEPVVADDHRAAREILQRVLQRAERLHVEVVRRLVEQEHVAPDFSSFAMWTRLRSPPDRRPTFFCWSPPLKLKAPQ
jgi:hypothetical protein